VLNASGADLIAGIDARYDSLIAGKASAETGDTTWYASQNNIGAWLEVKNDFDRIVLNSSLRLDRNSGYGYFLSPQIGIVYSPASVIRVKTSLGRAFRAPGFNDLYSPLYGNRNLKPEIGNSAEMRLEFGTGDNPFSAFSFFMRKIIDRIAWLPTQGGLWRPQNVNRLSIQGLEWETRYSFWNIVKIENQLTYLNGRQKNRELIVADDSTREVERPAAFIPTLAISSCWDIRMPAGLILNLEGSYASARKNYYENWTNYPNITTDTKTLAAYFIFNAGLLRTWFGRLSTALGCKNLLDVKYATQFGNTIDDLDYPMPPRTFYFRMSLE
jgi:outer membrane cobalamin receptor